MKISPVNSYNYLSYSKSPNNKKAVQRENFDSSNSGAFQNECYNRIPVNNINFKGGIINDKNSLSTRIAAALSLIDFFSIVLVASDIESAKNDLLGVSEKFPLLISQVVYVEDKNIKSSFMITPTQKSTLVVTNLGNETLYQKAGYTPLGISKHSSMYIRENSLFRSGTKGKDFEICQDIDCKPEDIDKYKIKLFEFNDQNKDKINLINRARINSISKNSAQNPQEEKSGFNNVGGQQKAIEELKKAVIYPMKYPEAFNTKNHGIILEGPPGTGKSLMARALANEADANFVEIIGTEMESKWVGETSKNWNNLFADAKAKQPSIIFIDEFDAVARKRAGTETSRHDDKNVNTVLKLMSDLEKNDDNVYVIAATNNKDIIDPAMLRSGRFGKHIKILNPDVAGCRQILDIHTKNENIDPEFNRDKFAQELNFYDVSGADIAAIAAEAKNNSYLRAGIFEKMENGTYSCENIENLQINQQDFEKALEDFKKQKNNNQTDKIGFVPL